MPQHLCKKAFQDDDLGGFLTHQGHFKNRGESNMAKKKKAPKKEVPECGWIQLELILQIITEPKKIRLGDRTI